MSRLSPSARDPYRALTSRVLPAVSRLLPGQVTARVATPLPRALPPRQAIPGGDSNHNGSGTPSTQVGTGATATGDYSVAVGPTANSATDYSVVVGASSDATGYNSITIGSSCSSDATGAIAIGGDVLTGADNAISIHGTAYGTNATVVGYNASDTPGATEAVALGYAANVVGNYCISIGGHTTSNDDDGIAIGRQATVSGGAATAIGHSASATGNNSQAFGQYAASTVDNRTMFAAVDLWVSPPIGNASWIVLYDSAGIAWKVGVDTSGNPIGLGAA